MRNRYWIMAVDWEYVMNNYGDYTALKTMAARIRDNDIHHMRELAKELGIVADFLPTTYKLPESEFLDPEEWADAQLKKKLG